MASVLGAGDHFGMCFFQHGGIYIGTYITAVDNSYIGIEIHSYSRAARVHFGREDGVAFAVPY